MLTPEEFQEIKNKWDALQNSERPDKEDFFELMFKHFGGLLELSAAYFSLSESTAKLVTEIRNITEG